MGPELLITEGFLSMPRFVAMRCLMQFGFTSLIHTAALARWPG